MAVQEHCISIFAFLRILTKSKFLCVTGEVGVLCRSVFCQEAVASSRKRKVQRRYAMENGGTRKLGDIMDNISNLISHSFVNH